MNLPDGGKQSFEFYWYIILDYFGFFQSLRFMQIIPRIMRNLEEGYFFQ